MANVLHTYRINGKNDTKTARISPRDAIVLQCMECFGWEGKPGDFCTSLLCSLHPFSPFGNGKRTGVRRLLNARPRKNPKKNIEGKDEVVARPMPKRSVQRRKKRVP